MSTEVRWRRGTAAEHASFTGALSEITHNTTNNSLCIHDGSTLGGHETLMSRAVGVANGVASLDPDGQVPESQLGKAPGHGNYSSREVVKTTRIPALLDHIQTAGYATVGDGGSALYKRVAIEPEHMGKVQSADGAWWELVTNVANVKMFGAKGDGVSNDAPSVQDAISYAQLKDSGSVYFPNTPSHYLLNSTIINDCSKPLTIRGDGRGLSKLKGGAGVETILKIGNLAAYSNTPQRVMDLSFIIPTVETAIHIKAESCILDVFNVSFDRGGRGIDMNEVWSFCISDCHFGNTRGQAVYAGNVGTGHNSRITSCGFFGCGTVLNTAAIYFLRSDNILVEQNQIEGCYMALEFGGCTSVRIISNYMEYGNVPFYFGFDTRKNSSVVMEGNWIAAYDLPTYIEYVDRFYFRANTVWKQTIGFGPAANSSGICIGQNTLLDDGVIDNPPWLLLSVINGWLAGSNAPAVNATSDGQVSIRGEITRSSGSGNQVAFILPGTFRPKSFKRLIAISDLGNTVPVVINSTTGSVYVEAGGAFTGTIYVDLTFLW